MRIGYPMALSSCRNFARRSICLYSGKFIYSLNIVQNTSPQLFSLSSRQVSPLEVLSPGMVPALLGAGIYIGTFDLSIQLDAYGTCFIIGIIVYIVALSLQPLRSILTAIETRC